MWTPAHRSAKRAASAAGHMTMERHTFCGIQGILRRRKEWGQLLTAPSDWFRLVFLMLERGHRHAHSNE